ncbi:MAG: hypothetical protein HQ592_17710 [Planctomycetes bacterium]|nr:hypothetical protein [Planctomycetota bacterium]
MLIRCPECGKVISQASASCPHCGCPTHLALLILKMRSLTRRWMFFSVFISTFGVIIYAGDKLHFAAFRSANVGLAMLVLGIMGLVAGLAFGR